MDMFNGLRWEVVVCIVDISRMGDGHFNAVEKNWCEHFSSDIIEQFSAIYLYDYVRMSWPAFSKYIVNSFHYTRTIGFKYQARVEL